MARPVNPVMSLMTWWICRFICVNALCMCCTCWLAAETNSFRCRSTVRTAQMSCPDRNAARSNPTERRNCNHWHSSQSVRRPGTFFMWRAFTKQGRMPRCLRISKSGIHYTPVHSSATVVTPHSQANRLSTPDLGKSCEHPHGILVPSWRHGYKHFSCANIDTGCIRLQHRPVFQTHPFVSSPPLGLLVPRLQITAPCLFHWLLAF